MNKSKSFRKPDWIGVGGRHCGTGWVYANLFEHPQIYAPIKEINYFHNDDAYFRGEGWYRAHWSDAPKKQIIGEYSTASRCKDTCKYQKPDPENSLGLY
jgi:hypothetical protein